MGEHKTAKTFYVFFFYYVNAYKAHVALFE